MKWFTQHPFQPPFILTPAQRVQGANHSFLHLPWGARSSGDLASAKSVGLARFGGVCEEGKAVASRAVGWEAVPLMGTVLEASVLWGQPRWSY